MNLVSKLSTAVARPMPKFIAKMSPTELTEFLKSMSDVAEKSPVYGRYTFVDIENMDAEGNFYNLTAGGFGAVALRSEIKRAPTAQIKLYAEHLAWSEYKSKFKKLPRKTRIELMDKAASFKNNEAPVAYEAIPIILDYASEQILLPARPQHLVSVAYNRIIRGEPVLKKLPTNSVVNSDTPILRDLCLPVISVDMLFKKIIDSGYFANKAVVSIKAVKTSDWYKLNLSTSDVKTRKELTLLLLKIKEEAPDAKITGITFTVPFTSDKVLLCLNLSNVGGMPRLSVTIPSNTALELAVEVSLLTNQLLTEALTEIKKELDAVNGEPE